MTIGETIRERAQGSANLSPDWYANELYSELSQVAETRFPEIGELCFFSYSAQFPEKYPFFDRRPLVDDSGILISQSLPSAFDQSSNVSSPSCIFLT